MTGQTSFYEQVYKKLCEVPAGHVTTYKDLATACGSNAARAVGTAMKRNTRTPQIPCHRVVTHDGKLGPYSAEGGEVRKAALLREEGVEVFAGKIIDFDTRRWTFK